MTSATLDLASALIEHASITPSDQGCQDILEKRLAAVGFEVEHLPFGPVSNLWARRGESRPLVCFAGHTDVVPPGPADGWTSPPFAPTVRGGRLYGRGSADMKGALAAMVCACEQFFASHPGAAGSVAFLVTSDEEGPALEGTRKVIETLQARGVQIDHCIVGEPTSDQELGDTLRVGRRGSLNGRLLIQGIQGHVAYPDKARNPIHDAGRVIEALCSQRWDAGTEDFPATSFQISSISAGTGATNVIPGSLTMDFNFRYSPASDADSLQAKVTSLLEHMDIRYRISWESMGLPFYTRGGPLVDAACRAVRELKGIEPEKSTGGGTSDGRYIAPTGAAVVELGLLNQTIHQLDENTPVDDLDELCGIYRRILEILLLSSAPERNGATTV